MQANAALLTFERVAGKPAPGFKVKVGGQCFIGKRIEPLAAAELTDRPATTGATSSRPAISWRSKTGG